MLIKQEIKWSRKEFYVISLKTLTSGAENSGTKELFFIRLCAMLWLEAAIQKFGFLSISRILRFINEALTENMSSVRKFLCALAAQR